MQVAVEFSIGKQFFKGDVHPPTPVVAWIGRYVDPLVFRIALVTDSSVNRHPVLERKDA
jgi:hypothetical protein